MKLIAIPFLCAVSSLAHAEVTASTMPRSLGTLEVIKPAFLSIEDTRMSTGKSLLVSSFNPFGSDGLSMFENIGDHLTALAGARATNLGSLRWPNEARMTPMGFISAAPADLIAVAGGFLVPGKATGAITLVDVNSGTHYKISADKKGFFYHRVEFVDMNEDGRLDILTARASKPIFGASQGELLWFEQPAVAPLGTEWTEHVLGEGPDVHFRLEDLDSNGTQEIVATQFFSKKLSLWWKDGNAYASRIIDADLGSAFDVQVVDLDADGKRDLLVTNHEANEKAAVFAYEIPADMKKGAFKRHTLLEGMETRQGGFNQASPGAAIAFHPNAAATHGKPMILVNGDGSQRAHMLVAKSTAKGDWSYAEKELVDAKSTVGMSAVGDVDGDGYAEIFVPAYDKNIIHAFTFAP